MEQCDSNIQTPTTRQREKCIEAQKGMIPNKENEKKQILQANKEKQRKQKQNHAPYFLGRVERVVFFWW